MSIPDSSLKSFYAASSSCDALMGFSLVLSPSNYQELSWERRVRCGSGASLAAGSRELLRNPCLQRGMLWPAGGLEAGLAAGLEAGLAAEQGCAAPRLRAAGAGGRGAAAAAQVCVSSGDFELTSGACHVRRLGKRAGCAWLLQEVPDLTLLPLLKCSCSFFSRPPSPP